MIGDGGWWMAEWAEWAEWAECGMCGMRLEVAADSHILYGVQLKMHENRDYAHHLVWNTGKMLGFEENTKCIRLQVYSVQDDVC